MGFCRRWIHKWSSSVVCLRERVRLSINSCGRKHRLETKGESASTAISCALPSPPSSSHSPNCYCCRLTCLYQCKCLLVIVIGMPLSCASVSLLSMLQPPLPPCTPSPVQWSLSLSPSLPISPLLVCFQWALSLHTEPLSEAHICGKKQYWQAAVIQMAERGSENADITSSMGDTRAVINIAVLTSSSNST